MTKRHPFGVGANKAGRALVKKMEKNLAMKQAIEAKLKERVVAGGTPEEQKRKAEWFKNHVIVEFYTGKDDGK